MALTNKQRRFCEEYLVDLNGTQAAIRAGYSKRSARQIADSNMSKHDIKEYIEKRMAEKESELIASQSEVMKYLTSVIRGQSKSSVVVVEPTGAREIEKSPDEKEKLKAAELLGKAHGIFTEKIEQSVDMDLSITVDYGEDE